MQGSTGGTVTDDGGNSYALIDGVDGGSSVLISASSALVVSASRNVSISFSGGSVVQYRIWLLEYAATLNRSNSALGNPTAPVTASVESSCNGTGGIVLAIGSSNQAGLLPDAPCITIGSGNFVCDYSVSDPGLYSVSSNNLANHGQWALIIIALCSSASTSTTTVAETTTLASTAATSTATTPAIIVISSPTIINGSLIISLGETTIVSSNLTILGNFSVDGNLNLASGAYLTVMGDFIMNGNLMEVETGSAIFVSGIISFGPDSSFTPVISTEPQIGESLVITVAQYGALASGSSSLTTNAAVAAYDTNASCVVLQPPITTVGTLSTTVNIETTSSCSVDSSLSIASVVGIVIGCLAFVGIVLASILGSLVIIRRRRKKREKMRAVLDAAGAGGDNQNQMRKRSRTGSWTDAARDVTG